MNRVIKDNFTIELQENDHFMVIFLNSFVKFHGKTIWEPGPDQVISKICVITRHVIKGLHCRISVVYLGHVLNSSYLTNLTGSGTLCLQQKCTSLTAVSRDILWPCETYIGFLVLLQLLRA